MKRKHDQVTDISEDERRLPNKYKKDRNTYLNEICCMMHTFGDVKEPKEESVLLMRAILRDQMNFLLFEAEKTVYMRKGREISHEDILFIMRKSKIKLKRMMEYLHILDMKPGLHNLLSESEDFYDLKGKGKRFKMCLEFLASIQEFDEFISVIQDDSIIDISALKRKMRRYWMTRMMDTCEYQQFLKFSSASFRPMKRFKDWLLQDRVVDLDVTNIALGMINFLARETIAEIVDMVLLMKMKKLGKNQHLQYEYFANSVQLHIKSGLNLETTETLDKEKVEATGASDKQTVEATGACDKQNVEATGACDKLNVKTTEVSDKLCKGNKVNGDNSANTTTNKIHTTSEGDSRDQMTIKMDANFKCFAYEDCRKKNIAPIKMNEDSNELNSDQDHLSHSSSRSHDEEILQLGGTGCKLMYERSDSGGGRTSGSESNVEYRSGSSICFAVIDDSEEPYNKLDLNEESNEAESNSGPIEFAKSPEEVPSNQLLNEKCEMWSDVSDEHIEYVPDSAHAQISISKMCPKIISELSNNPGNDRSSVHDSSQNSLFNLVLSSEKIFKGTPVTGTSARSRECLVDMSDTSDHEHFPYEVMKSCDHKKLPKKKISSSNHSKQTPHQTKPVVDTSAARNLLSDAAKNEVTFLTPIEPFEIKEAYARFQESSPMVMIFAIDIPRKTKLICLAESLSFDV